MALANRRSIMTLFSDPLCPHCHQVRIVLAEKGVTVDIKNVNPKNMGEELLELNPYGTLPTLVDRDLILYEARIIMEYLDERFPHPPLLPVYPVARAESRRMMYRIEQDWYSLMHKIRNSSEIESAKARKELQENFTAMAPVFANNSYFLSEEFSLVDSSLAPLIWRFSVLDIQLPPSARAVWNYAERVFNRDSFQTSLSEFERELRVA